MSGFGAERMSTWSATDVWFVQPQDQAAVRTIKATLGLFIAVFNRIARKLRVIVANHIRVHDKIPTSLSFRQLEAETSGHANFNKARALITVTSGISFSS